MFLAPKNPSISIQRTQSRKNSRVTDEDSDTPSPTSYQNIKKAKKTKMQLYQRTRRETNIIRNKIQ